MAGPATSSLTSSVVAAEQRAREFLAQKQWRKARDELKPLTKIDRPRFLPLLIKANLGLSQYMMSQGQVAEAQQVLAYLTSIATTEQLRAAELEMVGPAGAAPEAAEKLAAELADPKATRSEAEKLALADKLVLTFQSAVEGPAATELRAVQDGLLAASMQQWDRLGEILRPIPHRSMFAHWSLFIKGLAAFHTGETERAWRFLQSLPAGTVPARAGQSYVLWLAPNPAGEVRALSSEAALEGACRLLGQPGAGRLLLKADRLWKQARYQESYLVLRDALPGFPTRNLDWQGTLTEFYFTAPATLSAADARMYLSSFHEFLIDGTAKNGIEEMLICRMVGIFQDDHDGWENYLRIHEELYGANPRLASLVYSRLGLYYASVEPQPFGLGRPRMVDQVQAVACLRKAIELDPANLEAHLVLASVHRRLRQTQERNRLLDRMVKQFPEEKQVLVEAALGCIDRQANTKALGYLERARDLDQLDPRIPEAMVLARQNLARQLYGQRRLDQARRCLAAAEPFLTDKPDDFRCARWTNRLRQGIFETNCGEPTQGQKLLDQARAASPFPAAFHLFAHLTAVPNPRGRGDATPFWPQLQENLQSAHSVEQLVLLLKIVAFWQGSSTSAQLTQAERALRKCLPSAVRQPFTREAGRQMVELKLAEPGWRADLLKMVKTVLKSDPQDPLFRFYKMELDGSLHLIRERQFKQLESIREEASRRGDEATAQRMIHLIKRLESGPPRPPFLNDSDWEDDDDDDDDDWEDEAEAEIGAPGADLPPPFRAILEQALGDFAPGFSKELAPLISALKAMPDSEIEKARRTRPKEIPAEVFDLLVDLAKRGKTPPPNAEPSQKKRPQWRPPAPGAGAGGPTQPELF